MKTDLDARHTAPSPPQSTLPTSQVAIKIKTTAVKAYLVKPSSAVLNPGESCSVTIMLQPLQDNPSSGQHKFLVQAVPTTLAGPITKEQWTDACSRTFFRSVFDSVPAMGIVLGCLGGLGIRKCVWVGGVHVELIRYVAANC